MSRRPAALLLWAVVGLLWAFTAAAMMTVGVFVLPITLLATWAAARFFRVPGQSGTVLCGFALIPGCIAILNRDGPGTACHTSGITTSCTDEMSPWPWAGGAVVLVVLGVTLIIRARGRW